MKYQALKRLKTKSKLLKLCDTLKEAHETIKAEGASFDSFSYMGGFPIYQNEKNYYSIQGLHEKFNCVLGIGKEELQAFNFNN
jgi:hypothetical protein